MLSDVRTFSSDELFDYLKILAKKFRKLNGKNTPAELYLVGGASILLNYNFREMTSDIDAIIRASSAMKDAIRQVSDEHNLPIDWLNTDFKNTTSYTPNIMKYADYRCELSNVLRVYTISAEYLVAMKLMAGRDYKHDLSDVVGIVSEHNIKTPTNNKVPLTMNSIKKAVEDLYGDWNKIPEQSRQLIEAVFKTNDLETFRKKQQEKESENFSLLQQFEKQYPDIINTSNVHSIIENLKKKSSNKEYSTEPIEESNDKETNLYYLEITSPEQLKSLEKSGIAFELNPQKTVAAIAKVDKEKALESISKSNKPKLKR